MLELEEKLKDFRLDDLLSDNILQLLKTSSSSFNVNELILSTVMKIIREMEQAFPTAEPTSDNHNNDPSTRFNCTTIINGLIAATKHDLLESNLQMVSALGAAIAERDSGTSVHNYRVTLYSVALAKELGFDNSALQSIIKGSLLHDIGKIGIKDGTLLKKGKLTDAEFESVKHHVEYGINIIKDVRWLEDAHDIIRYHHERYDGSGYTKGLKGEEIPYNARIFAVADVFDSLTSDRPYKKPYPVQIALRIIVKGRNTLFDPKIIDHFDDIAEALYFDINSMSVPELEMELMHTIHEYFDFIPYE